MASRIKELISPIRGKVTLIWREPSPEIQVRKDFDGVKVHQVISYSLVRHIGIHWMTGEQVEGLAVRVNYFNLVLDNLRNFLADPQTPPYVVEFIKLLMKYHCNDRIMFTADETLALRLNLLIDGEDAPSRICDTNYRIEYLRELWNLGVPVDPNRQEVFFDPVSEDEVDLILGLHERVQQYEAIPLEVRLWDKKKKKD